MSQNSEGVSRYDTIRLEGGKVYCLKTIAGRQDVWGEWPVGEKLVRDSDSLELKKSRRAGLHFVRFSSGGQFMWSYRLRREGYHLLLKDGGRQPKSAAKEQDPILAVLRQMGAPINVVECHDEDEIIETYPHNLWYGCLWKSNSTDGQMTEESEVVSIKNASYAIETYHKKHGATYLHALHLWPGAKVEEVEKALEEVGLSYNTPLWEEDPYEMADETDLAQDRLVSLITSFFKDEGLEIRRYTGGASLACWAIAWIALKHLENGTGHFLSNNSAFYTVFDKGWLSEDLQKTVLERTLEWASKGREDLDLTAEEDALFVTRKGVSLIAFPNQGKIGCFVKEMARPAGKRLCANIVSTYPLGKNS